MTESASGGVLPDAQTVGSAQVQTPFVQQFRLKGKNVKGKQILDVDVITNSTSPDPGGNFYQQVLVSPKNIEAFRSCRATPGSTSSSTTSPTCSRATQ